MDASLIWYYLLIFIILFAGILVYFKIAGKYNIIDKPNERSSHTRITLRGGGIIFYLGILLYFFTQGLLYPWFFIGLTLIAAISFADDIKPQSSKLRLLLHFIAMLSMFYQWSLFSLPWYYTIVALVFCTGVLNAYNFMDGINGITGGYSFIIAMALWYINSYQISFVDNNLIYYLLLSLLIFNFFNFRKKARCFAGDVGSVSVAFILIFLSGCLIIKTADFSYIILFVVYGVDSALTVIHRLILKEKIFEAHRKHAYQLMVNELKIPHVLVSSIYSSLQAIVIIGLFCFYEWRYLYLCLVIVILSLAYILFKKKYFHLHLIK